MFKSGVFVSLLSAAALHAMQFSYQILQPGQGDTIRAGQLIRVHYKGWLEDSVTTKPVEPAETTEALVDSTAKDTAAQNETATDSTAQKAATQDTSKVAADTTSAKADSTVQDTVAQDTVPADPRNFFDNSYDRGEPLEFVLGTGQVIPGWEYGLVGMKVGEIRELHIPYELGYGDRSVGPIPPNSNLHFEVELVYAEPPLPPDVFKDPKTINWKEIQPGVNICDEKAGAGQAAKPGTKIKIHYTGWTQSGRKFSSTKDYSRPYETLLGAGKFIPGFEAGLDGLKPGSVRWMKISPAKGYGAKSYAMIPPNSTLIFRVEMVGAEIDEEMAQKMDFFPDTTELKFENGPEGLRYAVIKPGEGETPAAKGAKAIVHYTGWLTNGTKFDSSRDRGQPFAFPLGGGRVIRGWDIGVEGMLPGEKRILIIPPGLGYGSRGAGPIPADATLIFAVEYLGEEY